MYINATAEAKGELGTCKTSIKTPVNLYYCSFQGDTSLGVLLFNVLMLNFCAVCTLCISSYFS